jgi:hypothetical protein
MAPVWHTRVAGLVRGRSSRCCIQPAGITVGPVRTANFAGRRLRAGCRLNARFKYLPERLELRGVQEGGRDRHWTTPHFPRTRLRSLNVLCAARIVQLVCGMPLARRAERLESGVQVIWPAKVACYMPLTRSSLRRMSFFHLAFERGLL